MRVRDHGRMPIMVCLLLVAVSLLVPAARARADGDECGITIDPCHLQETRTISYQVNGFPGGFQFCADVDSSQSVGFLLSIQLAGVATATEPDPPFVPASAQPLFDAPTQFFSGTHAHLCTGTWDVTGQSGSIKAIVEVTPQSGSPLVAGVALWSAEFTEGGITQSAYAYVP